MVWLNYLSQWAGRGHVLFFLLYLTKYIYSCSCTCICSERSHRNRVISEHCRCVQLYQLRWWTMGRRGEPDPNKTTAKQSRPIPLLYPLCLNAENIEWLIEELRKMVWLELIVLLPQNLHTYFKLSVQAWILYKAPQWNALYPDSCPERIKL